MLDVRCCRAALLLVSLVLLLGCPGRRDLSLESRAQSMIGKSRADVLLGVGLPNRLFVDEVDGGSYLLFEKSTLQTYSYEQPLQALMLLGGVIPGSSLDLRSLSYDRREKVCVLLRFDPADRFQGGEGRQSATDRDCADWFRAALATSSERPVDDMVDHLELTLAMRAAAGDVEAAKFLARTFGEFAPLEKLADADGPPTAYEVYRLAAENPEHGAWAWKWLCRSAAGGDREAQRDAAWWHSSATWERFQARHPDKIAWARAAGLAPDDRVAYMWYTLAAAGGDDRAIGFRDMVAERMTRAEIADAEALALSWSPQRCP